MMQSFALELRMPQTIRIEVRGADVAWLDDNRRRRSDRSENAVPDVVERWVAGDQYRPPGRRFAPPVKCQAAVTMRQCDEDRRPPGLGGPDRRGRLGAPFTSSATCC